MKAKISPRKLAKGLRDPFDRDTTMGEPLNIFEPMHQDEVPDLMEIASCECCGCNFGYQPSDTPIRFCPSHSWLGKVELAGHLNVIDMSYIDPGGLEVRGMRSTMVYSYDNSLPDWQPKYADILMDAITCFLDVEPLEDKFKVMEPEPFYIPEEAVVIKRIRVNHRGEKGDAIKAVKDFLLALDKIYREIM